MAHFQRAMMMDVDQAAQAMRDEEMNAEIEDFIEGFNQPTYRGMRVNGQRVATLVIPAMGGPGTGGLRSPRLSADTSISRAETLRVAARKSVYLAVASLASRRASSEQERRGGPGVELCQ